MSVGEASIAELFLSAFDTVFSSTLPGASAASGPFYIRMRDQVVPRLLARFQTGVVKLIKRTETPTGDALQPFDIVETEYTRVSVVTGFPTQMVDPSGSPRNDYIVDSDLLVIFGANNLSVVPTALDKVKIDGTEYTIKDVKQIPAAGIAVLYKLQARK